MVNCRFKIGDEVKDSEGNTGIVTHIFVPILRTFVGVERHDGTCEAYYADDLVLAKRGDYVSFKK